MTLEEQVDQLRESLFDLGRIFMEHIDSVQPYLDAVGDAIDTLHTRIEELERAS